MAVFASGSGSNFQALAVFFKNHPRHSIELLICNKKDAYVLERSASFNIPSVHIPWTREIKEEAEKKTLSILRENRIDLVILAGFMRILSADFIRDAGIPIINIHPSLLPLYKGENAIRRAWEDKATFTGISIHHVSPEVDSGRILHQEKLLIEKNWSFDILEFEIHKLEHQWYPKIALQLCDEISRKKENGQ
jgi:phosphoribosylglycinamide formyltransferase-1